MEKIAFITDSACDIDEKTISKYGIKVLPFRIIYRDKEYIDKVEIKPEQIYMKMEDEIPKSSLPSMEDMEEAYEKLEVEGYTHVIAVVISSGLSGTYNALKIVSERHKKINTYLYDSKSTSIGEGIILRECGKLVDQGKNFQEIVACIPKIKARMHFFFVFGTLEYAKRGGRIGRISGTIGEMLDIKPIVYFDNANGVCFPFGKIRGRKRSLSKLVEIGKQFLEKGKCDAYIVHGNAPEDAQKVYDMVSSLPGIDIVYLIGQISAVVGVYSGPGTVGICYVEKS